MIHAVLIGNGLVENTIFNLSSPQNRDNCFEPYALLREKFAWSGIALNTIDQNGDNPFAFELHQDVQNCTSKAPAYLMLFETPFVRPANTSSDKYANYRKIFTWNDSLVDGDRFIKFNFPNPMATAPIDGFARRDRFCCLIAGNKAVAQYDVRELYSERVRAIRWFEKNAPTDFDLYGIDWDLPPPSSGVFGKLSKRFWRYLALIVAFKPFPSYRGKVDRKRDVLQRTRFSICYENVRDIPGYITEKIFDSFFAGCVPVYWGADNITEHIPADCFIDRRNFPDVATLYQYLKAMDEVTYKGYQQRIAAFLESDAVRPFGSESFAETIVSTIVKDLGLAT